MSKAQKVVVVMLAIVFALGIWQAFGYANPDIRIMFCNMNTEDSRLTLPGIAYSYRSIFGCSKLSRERMREFYEKTTSMEKLFVKGGKPRELVSAVELSGGKTIVSYDGYYTSEDGIRVDFDETLTFDFILTREILG